MTTWTAEDFAAQIGAFRREVAGIVRRVVVTRSTGGIWQMLGHALFDASRKETREVENYPGIGLAARPPDNGQAEAIVVNVGGPNNPAMVATRDEATRAKVNDVKPDETTTYNSAVRLHAKANGTIELRAHASPVVEPTIKATTYRSAEDTMLSALTTCLIAINTYAVAIAAIADPTNVATPTLTTALTTMQTAIASFQAAAATYATTVVKVQ